MCIMRSIHTLITLGISTVLLMGLVVQYTEAGSQTYPDDGVWEDTFDNSSSVGTSNCIVQGGEIVLEKEAIQITSYNFTQSSHDAYAFQSFFFFPLLKYYSPQKHLGKEIEFGSNDLFRLKKLDTDFAVRTGSNRLNSYVAQHFRFKVDVDPESLSYIIAHWYGRTDEGTTLRFYCYNSSYRIIGGWEEMDSQTSNGTDMYFVRSIPNGALTHIMDDSNYIDLLVVTNRLVHRNTLATNYVEISARTEEGYTLDDASALTLTDIVPYNISTISKTKFYWDLLSWDDYQPSGTEARYHVLYMNSTGDFVKVEESVLPGNNKGFLTSPVFLNNLSNDENGIRYSKLKILVNLSTNSPSVSPRIFNWALTWQNKSYWKDSFNTYYRIDSRKKVNNQNGAILISAIQDEWPLFGFDSGNTRASGGKGATSKNLYWFSAENVGGNFRNPVIGNGNVYIVSDSHTLHQYNLILSSEATEGEPLINTSLVPLDYDVVNSPAITDELVIVASGEQAPKGHENVIQGFSNNNLSSKWTYDNDHKKICYDASPVVDDSWIFITGWGGDNDTYLDERNRYTNNKLLVLSFSTDSVSFAAEYELPAPSFSSPAVTSDKIIVVCSSAGNDSVIALGRNGGTIGDKKWSQSVGAGGHASPVIFEDKVFVTCAQVTNKKSVTKIVAMNLNDGTILWNKTLGTASLYYSNVAESTPAIYNGVLYVASADGTVYALEAVNGTTLWSKEIYTVPLFSKAVLKSSPAYADNLVYVGTPSGLIYALDASTGNPSWSYETFVNWSATPVLGSPVVSNGLVFVADENGVLYGLGRFTTSIKQVSGRIISVPIRLPESLWWGSFYANTLVIKDVRSITFKLLDASGNVLTDNLLNGSSLTSSGQVLDRTVRLQADFFSSNLTKSNPKLFQWYIRLTSDEQEPFLNSSSFTPAAAGWLQEIVPMFTIKVKDNGTGLRVKSAFYKLEYIIDNVSQQSTSSAICTGENGTTAWQTLTINISSLPDYENISALKSLTFNITDLAGNIASKTVTFKQDVKKPISRVLSTNMKQRYNSTYIRINATANDNGTQNVDASGVKLVELYYRYSESKNFSGKNWIYFDNSTKTSPTWKFNFTSHPSQSGGYFELCTIATDYADNNESFPSTGDIMFLYDWKAPSLPSVSGDTLWFKERPQFSVVFEDDYRIDTIQYLPNFESVWTTLASDVNSSVYNTDAVGNTWILSESEWNQMEEDEVYYLYIRVNDTLGNTVEILDGSDAITIQKDTAPPLITIDVPSVTDEWSMTGNFTVSGLGNDHQGSGIQEALLYYRYSEDKSNWSDWTSYGDILDSSPFEWDFDAIEGDGYYEMKIMATDYAGNEVQSEVFPLTIASFPTTLAFVLVGLLTVLVLLSIIIYLSWRKKEAS
ncbi:MAG TPA: PQQ-binding-like beta-propeller repeat protein [Thermoplasmata archaeon]|nr:PQQ-binding-like beta-propeller repeat protein [Thermoplasmata archaeon]